MDKRKMKSDKPIITVDYEHYAHFLADTDWTEEQKQEYLQTIWQLICELVSFGIGVHPLQQIEIGCGKAQKNAKPPALLSPDVIDFGDTNIIKTFKEMAASNTVKKESVHEPGS